MNILPKGIFISGTDTGIGKTVVTASLASCLKQNSITVNAIKPLQTGTILPGLIDIEFVYKVLGEIYEIDKVCPYRFSDPLAPYVASNLESKDIDIEKIKNLIDESIKRFDVTLVEGAGGLLVPIKENYYMTDLIKEAGLELAIVIRPNLGTINHTLLTVKHARSKGIKILGLIISNYPKQPDLAEKTNIQLIEKLSGERIVGFLPVLEDIDVEKGKTGKLFESSREYFISDLGGVFNLSKVLNDIKI